MALWQTNTSKFSSLISNPFNAPFQAASWAWKKLGSYISGNKNTVDTTTKSNFQTTNQNKTLETYNSRYLWFDEEDYKRLVEIADSTWVTWSEKAQLMDELYQYYFPQVYNKHMLDKRQETINNMVYENGDALANNEPNAKVKLKMVQLSQMAKEKFDIAYNVDDGEVIRQMMENLPNWKKLLEDYLNDWNPEILYAAWIYDEKTIDYQNSDIVQWGIKGRVADASSNTKENWLPSNWEIVNPIGYLTEVIDTQWQKLANKLTIGTKERENLVNKINSLSQEDLQQYKTWYDNSGYNGSFEDYIIDMNKTWWQDLVWADEELKWIAEPNVFKFFGNMPASTIRLITASFKNATNPADSLIWLWKIVGTSEWREALKNRYLTAEWWANALNYDSVGTADEILSVTNTLWNLGKGVWKLTGIEGLKNNPLTNIWSPFDVAVDRALYGWDITYWTNANNMTTENVRWLYRTMDDLADGSKVLGAINRYSQDVSSLSKWLEDAKKVKETVVERWAEKLSWVNSAQDKLFQAQEPTLNRLSKERNTKNIRNKSDIANELVVEDIKKNGGDLPTDTQTRVDAHERAMKNKWKEIKQALGDKGDVMVSTQELADNLDKYISEIENLWISKNKSDLNALKEQSADLRAMWEVDLLTLEKQKEMINANLNDWDDKSIGNVYKNWMTELTRDMWKIEDQIISEIPWEFQALKNEFGALADGYGDVIKANVKAQRAKYGDSISNYSRIKWIGEIFKWIYNWDIWEIWKWATQVIWGEITQQLRDKDWLIEQWFKDLAAEMEMPDFKTARNNRA